MKILEHWFGLGLLTAVIILSFNTFASHSAQTQTSDHLSTCSANLQICSNEDSSTTGPNGIVKANINDHPINGDKPAYNRVVILFHWEPSTLNLPYCIKGWCPVVKAAAGGAYIGGGGTYHCPFNCYIQATNNDSYDPDFTLWEWWSARERPNGTLYDAMTGRPSL